MDISDASALPKAQSSKPKAHNSKPIATITHFYLHNCHFISIFAQILILKRKNYDKTYECVALAAVCSSDDFCANP